MRISRVTFGCRGVLTFDRMEKSRLHDWESERYYIGRRMPQRYRLLHPQIALQIISILLIQVSVSNDYNAKSANCKIIYGRPRKQMLLKIDLKFGVR